MGSSKDVLSFVNSQECEVFFVRYFSRLFDDRAFFMASQITALEAVEKACKAAPSWRMAADHCVNALEKLSTDSETNALISNLNKAVIECDESGNTSLFCERFNIIPRYKNNELADEIPPKMKFCIDLILCLLSSSIDYRDVWSVTRFFGRVCDEVLPALRRRAEETNGNLNIMSQYIQILLSYVMTAEFNGTRGDDDILSANFTILKKFTGTITNMSDVLQDDSPPTSFDQISVEILVHPFCFNLNSTFRYSALCYRTNRFVEADHTKIASKDFNILFFPQDLSIYTKNHVVAFALRDRLICLNCISDMGAASPLFRSPSLNTEVICTQLSSDCNGKSEKEEKSTPSRSSDHERHTRFVTFIDFDTPESNTEQVVTTACSVDSGVVEDISESEKENLDPDAVVILERCKNTEVCLKRCKLEMN
ncbi:unnamed protein product [Anisakis simplex]|uniref:DUF3453 domain-containing protein n=1 Tax=Anisakis simplex TaxID=6269 RepID=A0A0M3JXQ6_ANISI|nr:unnamed protein product [Anisakis simplex]